MTTTPTTATCLSCGTQNITGRFCPTCGTAVVVPTAPAPPVGAEFPQPQQQMAQAGQIRGRPRWLPATLIGVTVVAVGIIVAVILIAAGGKPSALTPSRAASPSASLRDVTLAAQNVYVPRPGRGFIAMMPAGWRLANAKPSIDLQSAVVVQSAQDPTTSLTAGVLADNAGSLASGAKRIRHALGSAAQISRSQLTLYFAGALPAWRINYTAGGLTQVAYLYDACRQRYAVIGASKPAVFASLKVRFGLVASTLRPVC